MNTSSLTQHLITGLDGSSVEEFLVHLQVVHQLLVLHGAHLTDTTVIEAIRFVHPTIADIILLCERYESLTLSSLTAVQTSIQIHFSTNLTHEIAIIWPASHLTPLTSLLTQRFGDVVVHHQEGPIGIQLTADEDSYRRTLATDITKLTQSS